MRASSTDPFVARESKPEFRVRRLRGDFLEDESGKRYIDFVMGWCVGNFGWYNQALRRRAARFEGPDYIYPGYGYAPWGELGRLLLSLAPRRLAKCFRATGGSEAVDLALQAAMVHTGRTRFLSIEGSYHGNTLGALSVGSSEYGEHCGNLLRGCNKIKPPLDERAIDRVERRLAKHDVAAFIMEPIGINLGVLIPGVQFMTELQRLCRRHGTLLVMDEVATGFGRTGRIFACEHFGIDPDMMTVAKAITGGLGGMGALLASASVARSMQKKGQFYSTYGWHPRSVDIAIGTLRPLVSDGKRLLKRVAATSEYFAKRLRAMRFRDRVDIRIQGLAIGIQCADQDAAETLQKRCRRRGLLVTAEGETVLLLPSLTIDRNTAARGLDILQASA